MNELALKLKKEYAKTHTQILLRAKCDCGRFANIIMSNCVTGSTIYAIIYCKKCDKFYRYSGGSSLEVWGETTYSCSISPIDFGSAEWNKLVKQINEGSIFVAEN